MSYRDEYGFIEESFGYPPSPQQVGGFDWIQNGTGHAFEKARAGTGKTTNCLMKMHLLNRTDPGKEIVYIVFNKPNQLECEAKVAQMGLQNVTVKTCHALGFSALRRSVGNMKIDGKLKWDYLTGYNSPVPGIYQNFVKKACGFAKAHALGVFGSITDEKEWYSLVEHYDLYSELEGSADVGEAIKCAIRALEESNRIGREPDDNGVRLIDFDDMLYLPLLYNLRMWQYPYGMGDEWQDANICRRALARKIIADDGRFVFVGDPAQAIYGFTGADNLSCETTIEEFGCDLLPLTVTYRCPKSVVRAVVRGGYVDDYQAFEGNREGEVITHAEGIDHTRLLPTDAILCRNTKPLIEYAYCLIRNGVGCHVEGRKIGEDLINVLTKWKVRTTSAFLNKLEEWETKQVERLKAKGDEFKMQGVIDKCETLRVLCEGCQDIDQVKTKIDNLFADTNGEPSRGVTLSTIHKAKGREWPNVYIMGFHSLLPSKYAKLDWQIQQENNLAYVGMTRAKEKLVLTI